MKLKLYAWSHCCEVWQFYGYFNDEKDVEQFLEERGYDPKYFKTN